MGWFSHPDCPYCGNKLEPTGFCPPYPSYRCNVCIAHNAEEEARQKEIKSLRKRISILESKQDGGVNCGFCRIK